MTALALAVTAGAVVAAAGWALAAPSAGVFLDAPGRAEVMRWLSLYVGLKTVGEVSYTVLRQRERVAAFALSAPPRRWCWWRP